MDKKIKIDLKHFYTTNEAAKILGIRPHDFSNNKRLLDLDRISTDSNSFSKDDLEFWSFILDLKNKGFNSEGIKNQIKLKNTRDKEKIELIETLSKVKVFLEKLKDENL